MKFLPVSICLLIGCAPTVLKGSDASVTTDTDGPDVQEVRDSQVGVDVDLPDADATADAGEDADTPNPPVVSQLVDPNCVDGQYRETFPLVSAPVDDIVFTGEVTSFVDAFLDRRYPLGALMVRGGRAHPAFPSPCDVDHARDPTSAQRVLTDLNVMVHECAHLHDANINGFQINTTDVRMCERGDTVARLGDTFASNLIREDRFSARRPPGPGSFGEDFYAKFYLSGSPDDGEFQQGDQGYNSLVEEFTQYLNGVAVAWTVLDQLDPNVTSGERDGLLTMMWYVQRYLYKARTEFPDAYARISNPCWRNTVLTLWGRAWLYLEATRQLPTLSLDTDAIEALIRDPELLGEIQRLRDLEGC